MRKKVNFSYILFVIKQIIYNKNKKVHIRFFNELTRKILILMVKAVTVDFRNICILTAIKRSSSTASY